MIDRIRGNLSLEQRCDLECRIFPLYERIGRSLIRLIEIIIIEIGSFRLRCVLSLQVVGVPSI